MKMLFVAMLTAGSLVSAKAEPAPVSQTPPNPADALLIQACENGNENEIAVFLSEGAEITAADGDGFTPLMAAAANSHPTVVAKLLGLHAPVDTLNKWGENALLIASWKGDAKSVEELCAAGADVTTVNKIGATALMGAASRGDLRSIDALLAHHADPNIRSLKGTALTMATADQKLPAMQLLLDHGADPNVFALPQEEGKATSTPLAWAAGNGDAAAVNLLLKYGAKPDAAQAGQTPFIAAAQANDVSIMQTLKDSGARIDAQDEEGDSSLIYAAKWSKMEALKQLVAWGANLNLTDRDGATALLSAARNGWNDAALYLVENGADVNVKDQRGETALGYAESHALFDLTAALKAYGATPVEPHIVPFPKPRQALPPPQVWALAVAAIYLQIDGNTPLDLIPRDRDHTENCRQMLRDSWSVHNHDELLAELHQLATTGHRSNEAAMGEQLAGMDDSSYSAYVVANSKDEKKLALCRAAYQKWQERTGLAFDLCRYVDLVDNGYSAGYLRKPEVWNLLLPMARKAQESFASWQELADNFLDGREIWAGQRNPRYEAVAHLLLNPKDPNSPWQLPWNTDLGVTVDTDTSVAE